MFRDSAFKKKLFVYGSAASSMCYAGSLSYCSKWGATLCCGAWTSHCCGAQDLVVRASVLATLRLSSCGSWALLLHSTWDLPGTGLEPVFPALAGRFLSTVPPQKSQVFQKEVRVDPGGLAKIPNPPLKETRKSVKKMHGIEATSHAKALGLHGA